MASSSSPTFSNEKIASVPKGPRFWFIFLSLCSALFLSALEFSAVANALPVIIHDLNGSEFAWVGTAYSLAQTAFQPLSGSAAEIFGRKASFIGALLLFALGSALCGSAQTMGWLIGGRTVQGLGGGAIISLSSIVVSDMVPLSERGGYNGLIGLTWTVGIAIGPLVGGALAEAGAWRWLFYLNLPVCAISLGLVLVFMRLPTPPGTLKKKLAAIDWVGNILVVGASTALVIGLTWGGVRHPWSDARVLVPLILGLVGLAVFFVVEVFVVPTAKAMVPRQLLNNRTTVSGYGQVFLNSVVVVGWVYYIPVYFQACAAASALRSSVLMLTTSLVVGPFVVAAGVSVTVLKRYRTQLYLGWALSLAGAVGFSAALRAGTPLAVPIGLQVLGAGGAGLLFGATYFPVLSPLAVQENARALALFAFMRALAGVWGVSIGSAILTNRLHANLPTGVAGGRGDVIYALIPAIHDMQEPLRTQVREAFGESLRPVWWCFTALIALGAVVSLAMKDVPMHEKVDQRWALEDDSTEQVKV